MTNALRSFAICAVLLTISGTMSGCFFALLGGAAVAVGSVVYVSGALETTQQVSLEEGVRATVTAVESLKLQLTDKREDKLVAHVSARGVDDQTYTIDLERKSDTTTIFRIRVGVVGNENRSRQVLSAIQANFDDPPAPAKETNLKPVSSH